MYKHGRNIFDFKWDLYLHFTAMSGNMSKLVFDDFYINAQGYKVFTEKYHLKRGYCCKSGCKHCPYGYDKNTDVFR